MDIVKIFGVNIHNISMEENQRILEEYLESPGLKKIFTPNTEIVMAAKDDENIRNIINRADLILADGIGLIYGSRMKKKPLKERVTGYDTSIKLLEIANENSYSLYLLGGKEGIARKAAENIKKDYPNITISGYHNGYFKGSHLNLKDEAEEKKIIDEINEKSPDIIFIGLGFPKQELWIDANGDRLNSKVIIGNGGVMDVLSGNAKRAPEVWQKLGLEWFYRLMKEPSRIKRQLAIPKFVVSVILNKDAVE